MTTQRSDAGPPLGGSAPSGGSEPSVPPLAATGRGAVGSVGAYERARKVAESMFAADVAARETMGIQIVSVEPGRAVLRMAVKPLHLNGHQICHGGFIFTLADTTFAYACNSHNRNAVAAGCSIEFLKPGHDGDVLTCEGQEQVLQGRHGIYDVRVTNQKGEVVAMFRGKSAVMPGQIFPEEVAT